MPESMTVVTSTPETLTEQNSAPATMATANAQTITIIGGDQYPVSSVNGKTGAVVLDADDVGAVATETGKGLSTNDYTDTDKEKVDNAVQPDELKYQYTTALTTPATITDSNGGKILNAVITGESTQDGTPTPTTPIDIDDTGDTLTLKSGASADDTNATTYTIQLTDAAGTTHTMRKWDTVKKHDDGKWYFDSNTITKTFDGTETVGTYASASNTYTVSTPGVVAKQILCNYYKNGGASPASAPDLSVVANYNNLYFHDSTKATADDFESQLATWNTAGDPLTVFYQTKTATSYELNAAAQETLNNVAIQKGNANIHFTNAVAPVMTADYAQNLKLYCSTLEARIEALENIQ